MARSHKQHHFVSAAPVQKLRRQNWSARTARCARVIPYGNRRLHCFERRRFGLKTPEATGPVGLVGEPEFPWTELDDVAKSISRFSSRRNWFRVLNGETGHQRQRSTMRLSESNPDSSGCTDSICGAAPTLRGNIDTLVNALRGQVLGLGPSERSQFSLLAVAGRGLHQSWLLE